MRAIALKTEFMTSPIGIDIPRPRLTWNCEGGLRQTAYEIRAYRNGVECWSSGRVESAEMAALFGAGLASRDRVRWQSRLWDENGVPGEWSEACFEMGLLDRQDYLAR